MSSIPNPPSFALTHAHLCGYETLQALIIHAGIIQTILPMDEFSPPHDLQTWDMAGDWLSLGGVDLQINGGLGLAFPDVTPQDASKLQEICDFLWSMGVDGFLPTLVTTSLEKLDRSLTTLTQFMAQFMTQPTAHPNQSAQILGVHLEGPCLNPEKRGAHPAEYLRPLTVAEVDRILGDFAATVKIITLAPELDATGSVIAHLRSLGIAVSLGHSQATAAQAQQAFAAGATLVTHAFNAMPGLHHREPGLLGAALTQPQVFCGFIADGEHVAPMMLEILLRAGHGKLFLVSDALSPLGLPDGVYPWDSRQIVVKQGTARLADGTLSGTTLPLLVGAQNLVKWGIATVEEAIALATLAPRAAIGLSTSLLGQPAHLLRWTVDQSGVLAWQRFTNINNP